MPGVREAGSREEPGPDEPVRDGELAALFSQVLTLPLALAVSGGADSIALMHLVHRWLDLGGPAARTCALADPVVVLTVDHGLRPESADEARYAALSAEAVGFPHTTLAWRGEKPRTAIQDAAREARYGLIRDFLAREGAGRVVATAHHLDDQAETLLMRLARGSGVDGLAGMRMRSTIAGLTIVRPLLAVPKSRLIATLRAAGLTWIEDPSNEAECFERVRWRRAATMLAGVGLAAEPLAASARRLARASEALDIAASELSARAGLDLHGGAYASLDLAAFRAGAEELRIRVLRRLLGAMGGQREPAGLASLEHLVERIQSGTDTCTLAGAIVAAGSRRLCVFREMGHGCPLDVTVQPGETKVWDGRFQVSVALGPGEGPVSAGALGEAGVQRLRSLGLSWPALPHRAAVSLPAFRASGRLLAVPALGFCEIPEDADRYKACFVEACRTPAARFGPILDA